VWRGIFLAERILAGFFVGKILAERILAGNFGRKILAEIILADFFGGKTRIRLLGSRNVDKSLVSFFDYMCYKLSL
jgi:hypothetical protein